MFHFQNYKTMKANVQISAVKKEFKNGQQGWQVFIEGMEGRLRCEMNFKDALKAMRYCFLLSKRLELQIDEIQLAALSLEYQQSKSAVEQAQAAEAATEVAAEVAAEVGEAEAEPAPEKQLEVASEEQPAAIEESPYFKQFCDLKTKHPDALLLFRCGDFYESYEEDAVKCADVLGITLTKRSNSKLRMAGFPHHALYSYLPKLIRAGHRVAICDQLEAPKPKSPKRSKKQTIQEDLFTTA